MVTFNMMIGNWTPGIGDPSFMGWLTVFSYYGSALMCLAAAIHTDKNKQSKDRAFWLTVFFIMAFLGVCKHFNLPSALTEVGRILARSEGWMEQRRVVQVFIMAGAGIGGIFIVVVLLRKIPDAIRKRHWMTLSCLICLVAFVTFRTISLHAWGTVLGYRIFGLRVNWIGELTGIFGVCVSVAAYWYGEYVLRSGKKIDGG
jgi:NADH:ubiquinone oxidoreductase subunit 6 (subunit J)